MERVGGIRRDIRIIRKFAFSRSGPITVLDFSAMGPLYRRLFRAIGFRTGD